MRMSSLLEGICLTLDPDFRFVKVLQKLFRDEGLFKELYARQISAFAEEAVRSVEAGVAILPLLRRSLESQDEKAPPQKNGKMEISLSGGFLFIAGVFEIQYQWTPGIIMILAGIALMGYSMIRRKK